MEKDRGFKIIAIVALIIAVIGVSLGFAAFSQNLTISPDASVKGDQNKFNVQFSTEEDQAAPGTVEATLEPDAGGIPGFEATSANLLATTVTNLKATFVNGKGSQKATYKFYVYNGGELDAFLKKITFEKEQPTCSATAGEDTATDSLVQAACNNVTLKITINGETYSETDEEISSKILSADSGTPITVVLEYDDGNPVDGDFDVDFGSITLNYSSSDGE